MRTDAEGFIEAAHVTAANAADVNNLEPVLSNVPTGTKVYGWCPKKYADIKRQANNDISIVQNFLLKQRNLANLNY